MNNYYKIASTIIIAGESSSAFGLGTCVFEFDNLVNDELSICKTQVVCQRRSIVNDSNSDEYLSAG